MSQNFTIKVATPGDAAEMFAIYHYYVETSAVTFDDPHDALSVERFADKIAHTLERYPWLIAVSNDSIIGYAYAGPLRERAAYDWSAEATVYLTPEKRGKGTGRALYTELERLLALQGIRAIYACITTTSRTDDPHLTNASPRFHERMGYKPVGTFANCGNKFGLWYDCIWMRKEIGETDDNPSRPLWFPDIRQNYE